MTPRFSGRQVELTLALVREATSADGEALFSESALRLISSVIPADRYVTLTDFDLVTHDVLRQASAWPSEDAPGTDELLVELCDLNPLRDLECWHAAAPLRLSDLVSRRALRRSPFYSEIMRPNGVEHQLKLFLPAPAGTSRSLWLARSPGADFSDAERMLLSLLRPHLSAACARADRQAAATSLLTPRENEILDLAGTGLANREIATRLVVSEGTVRTHLNHIYEKLGVHSRTAALAARAAAACEDAVDG